MHRAMRAGLMLIVGACIAGCPASESPVAPDSSQPVLDGAPILDSPPGGTARLTIAWATTPVVPAGVTPMGHRIDEARFRMENLKATVDVDPTDPNTTQAEVKLAWDDKEAPAPVTFATAPAGRYTSVVLQLDEGDGQNAFELRGESNDNDSFKFDDKASMSIFMTADLVLAPGDDKTLVIDIDLATAVDAIDIEELDGGNGVQHHLDADDEPEAMALFRGSLQGAFSCRVQ